jgi:hypothetical protein
MLGLKLKRMKYFTGVSPLGIGGVGKQIFGQTERRINYVK